MGTRRELYNQKQIDNLKASAPGAVQITSTPNNSFQGRPSPIQARGGATRVVNQLSESMRIAQAGNDAKIRRAFFFTYLEKENAPITLAMSQNNLTSQLEGNHRMMQMRESDTEEYQNTTYGNRGNQLKNKIKKDFKGRPLFPCPLTCSHSIPYGTAGFCEHFRKDKVPIRKEKVKKYKICPQCLKRSSIHPNGDCRAPKCSTCGGGHHPLLCDQEGGEQKMYNTQEQEKDGNGEEEDKKDHDDDKEQERMYQMEYEEAEREFGTPDEGEFEDNSESMWTIFEEDTDDADYTMEDQEEPNEKFWSMMNTEGEEKPSPTDTIKEIAKMDMNVTKETSQRRDTDILTNTETKSIKNSEKRTPRCIRQTHR